MTLIKIGDRYFDWGNNVKAPVSWDLTEQEVSYYVLKRHGKEAVEALPDHLRMIQRNGTNLPGVSLGQLVAGNKAGPGGAELTIDGIRERYTRDLYRVRHDLPELPKGTLCRVWNSRAGHCGVDSKAVHVRTFDHRNVFSVPLCELVKVDN